MPKFTLTIEADSFEEISEWVNRAETHHTDPALTEMVQAVNTATEPTATTQVQWAEPNGPVEDDGFTTIYPLMGGLTDPDPAKLFGAGNCKPPTVEAGEEHTERMEAAMAPPDGCEPPVPDTDSRGMPWDERIHAGSKTTNADGTWRKKRGVTDEETTAVEAELMGTGGPVPDEPFATEHVTVAAHNEPVQPAPIPTDAPDYGTLCSVLSNAVKSGAVKGVDPLYQHVGISGLAECKDRPDLIAAAVEWVNAQIAQVEAA